MRSKKIFTYNHTSNSLFWNCFSKYTSQSLYLIALAKGKFVGAFQKCLHIEALEKAKPCPYFQNLPPTSKRKKPLSRRVNHALIAAINRIVIILYHITKTHPYKSCHHKEKLHYTALSLWLHTIRFELFRWMVLYHL